MESFPRERANLVKGPASDEPSERAPQLRQRMPHALRATMVMPPPLLEGVPPALRTPLVARPPLLPGLSTNPQLRSSLPDMLHVWPAARLQLVHL